MTGNVQRRSAFVGDPALGFWGAGKANEVAGGIKAALANVATKSASSIRAAKLALRLMLCSFDVSAADDARFPTEQKAAVR